MGNARGLVLLVLVMSTAPPLWAQEQAAKLELYGGYDYIRFNIKSKVSGQPPSQTFQGNGGGGELVYNVNHWLGVLGDVSGVWATNTSTQSGGAAVPYLIGPRANFRRGIATPFAQVLLGGVVTSSGIETLGWQNHLAMSAGGGIDLKVSKHFSIRAARAEYLLTKIPDGLHNRQNNFRFSAGIVLRFG